MKRILSAFLCLVMVLLAVNTVFAEETAEPSLSSGDLFPVSILEFFGLTEVDMTKVRLEAYFNDCETGWAPMASEMTLEQLLSMKVTGKENELNVTGNTEIYVLLDENGQRICFFEFFGDLLMTEDGMYSVSE